MFTKRPVFLLCLLLGATFGQILSESSTTNAIDATTSKKTDKQKGDVSTTTETDLLTAASRYFKDGPSVFAQSFALRPVAQLMPNPRARYGPELGYGPILDRSDQYRPPVYNQGQQGSFAKRGGSVGYGGVYPIHARGRPSGGPPSGPGYGGGYGGYNNKPPKSYNERASEDEEGGGDYGSEYDEYDEPAEGVAPGGRQQGHGGSNYGGNSEGNNYDYGDPVQNGGYHFSGQTQEGGDEHGRNSGHSQYGSGDDSGGYQYGSGGEENENHHYGAGGDSDSDNHIYGSSNSDAGREYGGEGDGGYGSESGSSSSSSGGSQFGSGGSDTDGFDGFY